MASVKSTSYQIKSTLKRHGYFSTQHICDTLQGCIWLSTRHENKAQVIIKSTNKALHRESAAVVGGKRVYAQENIMKERAFLKYLTNKRSPPKSIVQYIDFFEDDSWCYLVMQNGGTKLFHFVSKAHDCIKAGTLLITEWHRVCRVLFKQMVSAVEYMHDHNVSHFDISLENTVISAVDILIHPRTKRLTFVTDDALNPIQIRICDLGLAELFPNNRDGKCNDSSSKCCGKSNYKSPEITACKNTFSAFANDVWCLGVTLFMMILGASPWKRARINDETFALVMAGRVVDVVHKWGRDKYVTHEVVDLLSLIFKYEDQRISIVDLKKHAWLN
eukprot:278774_1